MLWRECNEMFPPSLVGGGGQDQRPSPCPNRMSVTRVCLHQLQFKHWFEHGCAGGSSLLLELMPSRLTGIIESSATG